MKQPVTRPWWSGRLDDVTSLRVRRLAIGTAAAAAFRVIDYPPLNLVVVPTTIAVILLVAAALAAGFARLGRAFGVAVLGGLLILLGLYRLVSYGHGATGLGGSSTAALLTALGVAHLGLLLGRQPR